MSCSSRPYFRTSSIRERGWTVSGIGSIVPCSNDLTPDDEKTNSGGDTVGGECDGNGGVWDVLGMMYGVVKSYVANLLVSQQEVCEAREQEDHENYMRELTQQRSFLQDRIREVESRCKILMRENYELRQKDDMREQDRLQMEALMVDKAKLMTENSSLSSELKGLRELLDCTIECFGDENYVEDVLGNNPSGPSIGLRKKPL